MIHASSLPFIGIILLFIGVGSVWRLILATLHRREGSYYERFTPFLMSLILCSPLISVGLIFALFKRKTGTYLINIVEALLSCAGTVFGVLTIGAIGLLVRQNKPKGFAIGVLCVAFLNFMGDGGRNVFTPPTLLVVCIISIIFASLYSKTASVKKTGIPEDLVPSISLALMAEGVSFDEAYYSVFEGNPYAANPDGYAVIGVADTLDGDGTKKGFCIDINPDGVVNDICVGRPPMHKTLASVSELRRAPLVTLYAKSQGH